MNIHYALLSMAILRYQWMCLSSMCSLIHVYRELIERIKEVGKQIIVAAQPNGECCHGNKATCTDTHCPCVCPTLSKVLRAPHMTRMWVQ